MSLAEKYALAFDIAPVPMILVSVNGDIVLANERFSELFGFAAAELVGMNVDRLVPETARDRHPELRGAYHRTPTKRNMGAGRDLYGMTKSGATIPLELGLEPLSDGGKQFALVTAIDIRQRKMHEARMQNAMDAAASAMVMVNENAAIVYVNRAATNLFGYDENELIGQQIELLVPNEFRRKHPGYTSSYLVDSMARAMGMGRDLFAQHKDGHLLPVEIALTPIDSQDGRLVMSTIIDLSERVAVAEELDKKNRDLEAINIELSHFAYSASHDLKAPLSTIIGLLRICIEDLGDKNIVEVRDNLAKALEISQRSSKKIEGILQIARAGQSSIAHEPIALDKMVLDIWTDLTGGDKSTELVTDFSAANLIVTERPTLEMIFENLLSNALLFHDDRKSRHVVQVVTQIIGGVLRVIVSDNGVGIPEENMSEIFEMFKRLEERSGDGLGLALVRKQVDRLGGEIAVEGCKGGGARFIFSLPQEGF